MASAPVFESVEWCSTAADLIVVCVRARVSSQRPRGALRLLVPDGSARRGFASDGGVTADPVAGTWSVSFSLPAPLRSRLHEGLVLEVDGAEHRLPRAVGIDPTGERQDARAGHVIDPGVLAARRARRGELNEQSLTRRATHAEALVETVRVHLAELEQQLSQAEPGEPISQAEPEERISQAQPGEPISQAEPGERTWQAEPGEPISQAEPGEPIWQAEPGESISQAEAGGGGKEDAQQARQSGETLLKRPGPEGPLEARHTPPASVPRSAPSQGAGEEPGVRDRDCPPDAHEQPREPGARADQRIQVELSLLRGDLERARESAQQQHQHSEEADRLLDQLGETMSALRGELESADSDRRVAEQEGRRFRRERAVPEDDLRRAAQLSEPDHRELVLLRDELAARSRLLEQAQGAMVALEDSQAALRAELEDSQAALRAELEQERVASGDLVQTLRLEAERALAGEQEARSEASRVTERETRLGRKVRDLLVTAGELRAGFAGELAALRAQMRDELTAERTRHERELASMEGRVDELRRQLAATPTATATATAAGSEPPLGAAPGSRTTATGTPANEHSMAARLGDALERLRELTPPPEPELLPVPEPPPVPEPLPEPEPEPLPGPEPLRGPEPLAGPDLPPEPEPEPEPLPEAQVQGPVEAPTQPVQAPPPTDTSSFQTPTDALELSTRPRPLQVPAPSGWLAPALRRVAERRDAHLAADLIAELLSAQGLVVKEALTYRLTIEHHGSLAVVLNPGRPARVDADAQAAPGSCGDFHLTGSLGACGDLVAGPGSWRRRGFKVKGSRPRARRLMRARRRPLTLAELAGSRVHVRPGLLLLALSEAVDPEWTRGEHFLLRFVIQGPDPSRVDVGVADGKALSVSDEPAADEPAATVYLSAPAFLCLVARAPLPPAERVMCTGQALLVERFLAWTDRAQGLRRASPPV